MPGRTPYGETELPPHKRPKEETFLRKWLVANGISQGRLARAVGTTTRAISMWALGQVIPDLINAYLIEHATKGGVPVSSWLSTEIARKTWGMRKAKVSERL